MYIYKIYVCLYIYIYTLVRTRIKMSGLQRPLSPGAMYAGHWRCPAVELSICDDISLLVDVYLIMYFVI